LGKTGDCVAGNYSIADMAIFPWVATTKARDIDRTPYAHVERWFEALRVRPAVEKGMEHLKELRSNGAQTNAKAREILFGIKSADKS
jgi:GST-like protein